MERCSFTEEDGRVIDQIREVLEEMEFTIEDGFCDQSRLGYHVTCKHWETPFGALITYDPKEGSVLCQISFRVTVPQSEFQAAYAHLNEVNSQLIFGHFALCSHCGEISFSSGFFQKNLGNFKEKFAANFEQILKEAAWGRQSLSNSLPCSTKDNSKEERNV